MENWKDIVDYDGFQVSNQGQVRSCWVWGDNRRTKGEWRIRKLFEVPSGHRKITLKKHGKGKQFYVHRLVLLAFDGPQPVGKECCHRNGVASDNRLENLYWDTHAANQRQMAEHGRSNFGIRNPNAKLKDSDVRRIRVLLCEGLAQSVIARLMKIDQAVISCIKTGKAWKHVKLEVTC